MSGTILAFQGVSPTIAPDVFVAPTAVVIGDTVIGAGTSVWFNCVIRGDVHEIRIGERTNIQDGTIIHVTGGKLGTYIGSDITIGHGAILHACTLEDGCFVGMGAVVLDGAVVETGGMVAAGAVVTPGKRVKKGELWGGNPARMLRSLSDEEMAFFPVSAEKYAELAAKYFKA
ncbi:carbonic anhydrase family 3 [Paramagnetospirillum magnetotacticum MS-1]|uniref:Carbonic anhydrase family 3 n=1 Tax=Paramagnetospirillum magnetotacticum MS-1 TaxID=272627 RepID=A0A0C2YXZ3_PARME|nr:gamma carbonic anhydrase family protein [Paramagnetospirillum magnetotacticum]KIL99545.1 carbonic anhydrase family 3 [Paramagnetospirillum magnetotacticum MS-1]